MAARWARIAMLVAAAGATAACRGLHRAGNDLLVVGTAPVHLVTRPAVHTDETLGESPGAAVLAAPFLYTAFLLEDAWLTVIHAGDFALFPILVPANAEPLETYAFDRFPPAVRKEEARELETSVSVGLAGVALLGYLHYLEDRTHRDARDRRR